MLRLFRNKGLKWSFYLLIVIMTSAWSENWDFDVLFLVCLFYDHADHNSVEKIFHTLAISKNRFFGSDGCISFAYFALLILEAFFLHFLCVPLFAPSLRQ